MRDRFLTFKWLADRNSFHRGVCTQNVSVFGVYLTVYQGSQTQTGLGTALDHKSRRAALETFKVWRGKVCKWFLFVIFYSHNILEHEFRSDNWIGCVHFSIKIKKYSKPGEKKSLFWSKKLLAAHMDPLAGRVFMATALYYRRPWVYFVLWNMRW